MRSQDKKKDSKDSHKDKKKTPFCRKFCPCCGFCPCGCCKDPKDSVSDPAAQRPTLGDSGAQAGSSVPSPAPQRTSSLPQQQYPARPNEAPSQPQVQRQESAGYPGSGGAAAGGMAAGGGAAAVNRTSSSNANMRPWFGAVMKFVDDIETGRRDDLAQIYEVEINSPASKAGLRQDDILRTWDGRTISGQSTWKQLMQGARIGQTVQVGVIRAGHKMTVPVTLEGTTRTKSGPHRVTTATEASSGAH